MTATHDGAFVETPPAASPSGRRAYFYSATAEELAGRVEHHPRHSATLPPDPPPFRLPAARD